MILRLARHANASDRMETPERAVMLGDEPVRGEGGTPLWHALETGTSRLELIDRIVAEYGVNRERAAAGADLYLRQLRHRGLLAEY